MLVVVSVVLALPVGSIIGGPFGDSAVARLSVAAGFWALAASLTTLALGWLMLDERANPGVRPLTFATLGSVASAVSAAAVVLWTEDHFGRFDPEYVGPTLWLPVLAAVVTLAATWMLGLKGTPARLGLLAFIAASSLIGLLALLNLPGLLNGVTAKGIPLMLAFASAGVVIVGGLVAVRSAPHHFLR